MKLPLLHDQNSSFVCKIVYKVLKNSLLRHDRRNELVISNVERGVIDLHAVCGHALAVPHIGDFLMGALFDMDVCTSGSV